MKTATPDVSKGFIAIPEIPCGSVNNFIPYLEKHQETPVATLLEPFKSFESELRKVYAQQPDHEITKDGHINMVPIFSGHEELLKTRARSLENETEEDKSKYIMTLKDGERKANGAPAIVSSLKEFQKNFNLFSESSLADFDWSNVVAAGSAVTTALLPVPGKWAANKRSLREYYHEHLAPASDVDLFLYGLNEKEALEKIKQIEQSIKNNILHEVTTIRTKNAITIASQYPTRHVQIVLRLYDSISQIITGFDVDCACAAYDGKNVFAAPRAICAFITQCNTIDLTRRSPSYENRLSKYSHRGFEVHWPLLDRSRIDPTIFERSFGRTLGLARLLILEALPKTQDRDRYMDQRRVERGRPAISRPYRNLYSSNIKEQEEDEVAEWVEDDEIASYHTMTVPYGQKYHAAKINRLLYAKDLLLNAEWNQPKEREVYLHRHPCFFGTAVEVVEDCCENCPVPKTEEELKVTEVESKTYISGKLSFIVDDPGRQEIGSFNPITDDEWTTMAYVGDTSRLCQAIVDMDLEHVQDWCSQEGVDINRRDHTGRTPLHLAVMVSSLEIVQCLVNNGARLIARLVDGRTALHIAAARGEAEMVKTLMDKSLENEEEEEEKEEERREERKRATHADRDGGIDVVDNDSSDSDSEASEISLGDSDTEDEDRMTAGSFVKVDKESQPQGDTALDESTEDPDVYDVDVVAWDYGLSPLHLAILNGHTHIIDLLASEYGADVMLPVKIVERGSRSAKGAIMTIVLAITLSKDKAKEVIKLLIELGATSAQADMDHYTVFHYAVNEENGEILDALLAEDRPAALSVINNVGYRHFDHQGSTPLNSAIANGHKEMVTKLLAIGAKPTWTFDDWVKYYLSRNPWAKNQTNEQLRHQHQNNITQPIIKAAEKVMVETVRDLLIHGADPQTLNPTAYAALQHETPWNAYQESILDVVNRKIKKLQDYHSSENHISPEPETLGSEDLYTYGLVPGSYQYWTALYDYQAKKRENDKARETWVNKHKIHNQGLTEKKVAVAALVQELETIRETLIHAGSKSFRELHPRAFPEPQNQPALSNHEPKEYETTFGFTAADLNGPMKDGYINLFNAIWKNDAKTVEELTLAPWTWKSEEARQPPLKIAVRDRNGFSPFAIAVLRGNRELAKKVVQICMSQYYKDDGLSLQQRWALNSSDSDDESFEHEEMPIFSEMINDNFTIDNLAEVAEVVKSNVLPLTMIEWNCNSRRFVDPSRHVDSDLDARSTLFEHAVETNDQDLLKFLIEISSEQQARTIDEADEHKCYTLSQSVFWKAIQLGRTAMLGEMIKTTGAGISLNQLVKTSGVEVKKQPKYYQGLTVGGKKRADWAQAPGQHVRAVQDKIPPLLEAARFGSIDSLEWFMSDAPLRRYKEFAESNKHDKRLQTMEEAGKSFSTTVTSWLAYRSDLVLHSAILYSPPTDDDLRRHLRLIEHLISVAPGSLAQRTAEGFTPLHLAVAILRPDIAACLISAGADIRARDKADRNIIHLMLVRNNLAVLVDAEKLQVTLELFDKAALQQMFTERCNQAPSALTPLAYWMARNNGNYKDIDIIETLAKYSNGEELEMINGEGDLPVHVAIKQNLSRTTELLLSLNPVLLYRENATGRTPLEMSGNMCSASAIESYKDRHTHYRYVGYHYHLAIDLLNKPAIEFVEPPTVLPEDSVKRTWEICAAIDGSMDEVRKKRRLVSLSEANEVAKRVAAFPLSTASSGIGHWAGHQAVVYGGLVEKRKKDRVGEWLMNALGEVQGRL